MSAWRRRSKFNVAAKGSRTVHGWCFDSRAEAVRYQELLLLGTAGELDNLELQPMFRFVVNGLHIATYRADFAYRALPSGELVIEDVKGVKTPVYSLKKRLLRALFGIEIREVTRR